MYKEEKKKIAKEILKDFEEHYKQLLLICYTPWQTALKSFKDKYEIEPWVNNANGLQISEGKDLETKNLN